MVTYLDRVLYLYPDIQGVIYWHTPCEEAPSEDPYERLLWNNEDIPKPDKATLDNIDEKLILKKRLEKTLIPKVEEISKDKSAEIIHPSLQLNYIAKALFLLYKGKENWTAEESTFAARLLGAWAKLDVIKSNELKLKDDIADAVDPSEINLAEGWG